MHNIFIFVCLLFAVACNNNNNTTIATASDTAASSQTLHTNVDNNIVTGSQPIALNGCYQMTMKRDTATMQINLKDSTITGNLAYNFYGKDRNTGTLKGVLRNNTILADYTFESEGTTSVREVVFQIKDDMLVPAFGDLTQQNEKIIFKDKAALQYQTDNPFIKVSCP